MRGHSFSPLYWKSVHLGLTDFVCQVGVPKIFWTIAPYVWSFPHHAWVRDEMQKELRHRLHLPIAEIKHMAHTILQIVTNLMAGMRGTRGCDKHRLLQASTADGELIKIHCVCRLEFQDGSRKKATQDYHGSGLPHAHVLFFFDDTAWDSLQLERKVCATLPPVEMPHHRGYVLGSQLDQDRKSGWPVHMGASGYDKDFKVFRLHHTEEDCSTGLRAYFIELMDVLKCHQDLLIANDVHGMLRAYVAKYVYKFSDSAQNEWLNDAASASSIAATVLCRYRPYEPEIIMQLLGASFRQWSMSTVSRGKRMFIPPVPDQEELPAEIQMYITSAWVCGCISLLDFLRKTNAKGDICNWLKKQHEASGSILELGDYAANYKMYGEKVVAAETLSKLNDRYYGQWLVLNVPFTTLEDLYDEQTLARVPYQYRYLAMALRCEHSVARSMWTSSEAIAADMKLEAHREKHITAVLHMIDCNRKLIDDYVAGRLDVHAEEEHRQRLLNERGQDNEANAVDEWNQQQVEYMDMLQEAIDRALTAQLSEEEQKADEARSAAREAKLLVCMGPPGTGKTRATMELIEYCLEHGGRVLFALPTAQLAARMKARFADRIEIDTCAASFGFMEDISAGAIPLLSRYTLIVVDEISQLEAWQFDHIVRLWEYAERVPALAMMGDRWQMSGFGEERPWHSRQWFQTRGTTICTRFTAAKMRNINWYLTSSGHRGHLMNSSLISARSTYYGLRCQLCVICCTSTQIQQS